MTDTKIVPTPYRELVTRVGHQRIIDALSAKVLTGDLAMAGYKAVVEAQNWNGALCLMKMLNAPKEEGHERER